MQQLRQFFFVGVIALAGLAWVGCSDDTPVDEGGGTGVATTAGATAGGTTAMATAGATTEGGTTAGATTGGTTGSECIPQCTDKQCGPDLCGGSCGDCLPNQDCSNGLCVAGCVPQCNGLQCGDDTCGGSCGMCAQGQMCTNGLCVADCTPQCNGKQCGDDGCGGQCGSCPGGFECENGTCVEPGCVPTCDGKECGPDGCGGECGLCKLGTLCNDVGICIEETVATECGDVSFEGCCAGETLRYCENNELIVVDCTEGPSCGWDAGGGYYNCQTDGSADPSGANPLACTDCVPECGDNLCGTDGCGGSCGTCGQGEVCDNGQCVGDCTPACDNLQCGDDGCGGTCGTCNPGTSCTNGLCIDDACVPDCEDKECGNDGCGNECGVCADGLSCVDSLCVEGMPPTGGSCAGKCSADYDPAADCQCDVLSFQIGDSCSDICDTGICADTFPVECGACVPDCTGMACGDNGCGGSCGTCDANENCEAGICAPGECLPKCDGKQCGSDGCEGSCGACDSGFQCTDEFVCVATPVEGSCWLNLELCEIANQTCLFNEGLTDAICYTDAGVGQPCGWGVAGCGEGASCIFVDTSLTQRICVSDLPEGGSCGGFGSGACSEGTSCQPTADGSSVSLCYKNQAAGQPCGAGLGLCEDGSACWALSVTEDGAGQDFQCLADQAVGNPCGLGFGSCTDGACIAQNEGDSVGACVSTQLEADAFCGDLFGYCGDYLVCNKALETATFGTCKPLALAGQACGYGESWCVGGASCLYMDETQTAAQCYKDGFPGETCGVGYGACLDGLNCVAENAGDASGVCTIP